MDEALLTACRGTVEKTLTQSCVVMRNTTHVGLDGLTSVALGEFGEVPCRISTATSGKRLTIAGGEFTVEADGTLPWGTFVWPGDILRTDETDWRVLGVAENPLGVAVRVALARVPQ